MEKKGYRKGRDLGDWRVGEMFVGDVKIRDIGEAESKPLLCVCVCVYRVCTVWVYAQCLCYGSV